MASRSVLSALLHGIMRTGHVYFQPPESEKMKYPAIVYSLNDIDNDYANNNVYSLRKSYQLILIDEDPDSPYVDKIANLSRCRFSRFYTADGLNHWVFVIYN